MAAAKKTAKKGPPTLYRWCADFGRMGNLCGLFVTTPAEVAKAIGSNVYFGEVLGKHSEISCDLEAEQFQALTDDESFVAKFVAFGCASGTNPLAVLADQEADN